jgi:hypothetical protein
LQILEVENGVDDVRYVLVVGTALDHEDAEVGFVLSKATCDDAACCATWYEQSVHDLAVMGSGEQKIYLQR